MEQALYIQNMPNRLQEAADAHRYFEQALGGAVVASLVTALGLQGMYHRGYSMLTRLAVGVLSEGGQLALYHGAARFAEGKGSFSISGTLDPTDPTVAASLPHFPRAYLYVDADKLTVTDAELDKMVTRGEQYEHAFDRFGAVMLGLWGVGLTLPMISGLGRLVQGVRRWHSFAAATGLSLIAMGFAAAYASEYCGVKGGRLNHDAIQGLSMARALKVRAATKDECGRFVGKLKSGGAQYPSDLKRLPALDGTQLGNLLNNLEVSKADCLWMADGSKLDLPSLKGIFENWPSGSTFEIRLLNQCETAYVGYPEALTITESYDCREF